MRKKSSDWRERIPSDLAGSIHGDSDVTSLTPSRSPGISDDPVKGVSSLSPTNCSDGMVIHTADTIEYASSIRSKLGCDLKINSYRAWSKGGNWVPNTVNLRNSCLNCSWVKFASSLDSFVRVWSCCHLTTSCLNVLKSSWGPTTDAAVASSSTVNHLLFWKSYLCSSLHS